jgi:hypothetical protein
MRTALLIRCSRYDADKIRAEAIREQRTISNYVLGIVMGALETNEPVSGHALKSANEPRTAILVRCEESEAGRIRDEAKRRDVPLNVFVLHALKQSWMQVPTLRSIAKSTS